MSSSSKIRRAPARLTTGAFILDSGLDHLKADEGTAIQLHTMAAGAYPFLDKVDPVVFTRALAVGELVVGGLLLVPIIPARLAGVGLTGFATGLIGLYVRTPGLRREHSVFPTPQGLGYAKDTWLGAIGVSLLADAVLADTPITRNDRSVPGLGTSQDGLERR
jgi:hypothetical protein